MAQRTWQQRFNAKLGNPPGYPRYKDSPVLRRLTRGGEMDECYNIYAACCSIARELVERSRVGLEAYTLIAEPTYNISRIGETSFSSPVWNECHSLCRALHIVNRGVNNGRLCILGPNTTRIPEECNSYGGPEPAVWFGLENGVRLLYITGDLDQSMLLIKEAAYTVDVEFIHIHSDNIYRLQLNSPQPYIIYTSQVCRPDSTIPLGGFTDGDRAVILGMLLGASEIIVHGYGGGERYWYKDSKRPSWKRDKLYVMRKIIEYVSTSLGYKTRRLDNGYILTLNGTSS